MPIDPSPVDPSKSAPSAASQSQVDKLTEAIIRSQHSYRELIDSFDQALFTLTLEGVVRVANLRLAEHLGVTFQDLIGRPLGDFIDSPTLADAQHVLPEFLKTAVWSGIIPVWLKRDGALHYFDCRLQSTVEGGNTSITGWARDVTKQHESEIRFKELFETFSDGILLFTPEGQLLDANPALVRILGFNSKEEMQLFNFRDLYADPTQRDAILREVEVKGAVHEREVVMRRKDGRLIHCLTSGSAMRDASGRAVRLQGTLIDITQRREMEKRLEEEQSFTRRLVAGFPDLVAVLDREGNFIYISDHVEKVLGWKSDNYVGRMFGTRANEEDKEKLHAMFRRIVSGEDAEGQVEFRSPHADGTYRDLLLTARPFFDEEGKICGLVTAARDISERKRMEQKLRQEQQFVKSLVECFPDLIMVIDKDGRFEFVSDRIKDVVGLTPAEYLGRPVGQRIESEDLGKLRAMFQAALSGQRNIEQIEIHARHVNGTIKTVRVTANALYDGKGNIVGMVSSGRDVTESKQLEQQLADKEKFASMGQMMAGAAHELNNPLTAILGVSDLLRERATDESSKRQIDLIHQQARRAATIVQNLLAFSRPVARGRATLQLDDILKEAISIERMNLEKRNIRVTFSAPDGPLPIDGDRKLLLQVFLNIITNAEQSISPAREQGELKISIAREGEKIGVTFADDGPGIPADIIGKVFDPFFTTKRPGGGSGLGLTISRAVTKEHGGTIDIESEPGAGAVVRVVLPAAIEKEAPPPATVPPAELAPALEAAAAASGHSVLIVDDEEGIREIVREGLAGRAMKVHSVGSSEEAIAWLAQNSAEVVVCDFNLPGMNGEKLFDELRRRMGAAVPQFVFMTGELVSSSVTERYQEMGARVLGKPFQLSALAALVTELLQPHSSPAR
jgi:PAS domain S-box-containing protein